MKVFKGINFAGQASAPSSPANGDVYYDTTLQKLRCYQNGAWVNLSDSDGTVLLADGTVSAPSLSFLNETGLGLYRQGAGVLAIAQGGADLITFDAAKIQTETPMHIDKNIYIGLADQFPVGVDGHTLILRTDGTGSAPFNEAGTAIYRSRVSSTAGRSSHLFYTGSPTTLAMSIDENQKITLGASGGTQDHLINGNLNLAAQGQLRLQDTTGGEYVGHRAPGTVTSSHTYTWPAALPAGDRILQSDSSGNLSWVIVGGGSGDISNGGNSFGSAITIGTNDAFALNFETNNVVKGSITSAGVWTLGESAGTQTHAVNGNLNITRLVGVVGTPTVGLMQVGASANQTLLSGTTQEGLRATIRSNSSATARTLGFVAAYQTEATAYTTGVGAGIRIQTPTIGATSIVTRNIGLLFQDVGTGGTNNAFISDNEAFTGNWFINSTSTNSSRFGGSVGIGSSLAGNEILRIGRPSTITSAIGYGIFSDPSWTSSQSTEGFAVVAQNRGDATFNAARATAIYIPANNFTAGAAVTRVMGLRVLAQTQGSTGNASICDNESFTGNWFINSTSTNASLISGSVTLGASAGTAVHQLNGGVRHTVRSITGATTLDTTTTDYIVLANSTSAAFTVTLPAVTSGRKIIIKDSGGSAQTNNITVSPASGTIDGAASFVINNNYQSIDLVSDGTNWFVV